jgi:hypothetical protein
MKYTVKGGDTLSGILKKLGVKSYSSPSTWRLVQTKSGSASIIRPGEVLDLSRVPGLSSSSNKSTSKAKTPAEKIAEESAKNIVTKEMFQKRFGTEEELMPTAAMQQFAAQQINPEALRQSVRTMANMDWKRGISGSGAQTSGYGMATRDRQLNELERQRRTDIANYMQTQKDLFGNWYAQEWENYQTSKDPSNYTLSSAGLGGAFNDLGWTNNPTKTGNQYAYNALDMRDYLRTRGPSGYAVAPENLYGSITKLNI